MPRGSPRSINYGFTCQSVAEIWGWQHPVLLGKVQETEYGDNARIELSFLSRTSGPYLLTYLLTAVNHLTTLTVVLYLAWTW